MIIETGRIVSIEPDGLWVETIQRSACGNCQARKGCGQRLLAEMGSKASRLKVLLEGRNPAVFKVGEEVRIAVPEEVISRGAVLVYMTPLLTMLIATWLARANTDGVTAFCALLGLLVGAFIVRVRSWQTRFDPRLQPVLMDSQPPSGMIHSCKFE